MFQRSTLTFGDAKAIVAGRGGKTSTDQLTKAGRCIQSAFKHWNKQANWKWLATTASVNVTSGNVGTLPYDFKDVYTAEVPGNTPRTLDALNRRTYHRAVWDRSTPAPTQAYDMYLADSAGQFEVIPPPESALTLDFAYYRRMTVPCSVSITPALYADDSLTVEAGSFSGAYIGNIVTSSAHATDFVAGTILTAITSETEATLNQLPQFGRSSATISIGGDTQFLDIPSDYEMALLAYATHEFLSDIGAPETRLAYFLRTAESGLTLALETNGARWEDMDICIQPPSPHSVLISPRR